MEMVVFDMAGTTLQIGGLIPVALREGFLEEGIELTDEEIRSIRGLSKIEAIRNHFRWMISPNARNTNTNTSFTPG